jgi:hypothetical protein
VKKRMRTWNRGRAARLVALAGLVGLALSINALSSAGANGLFPDRGYSPTAGIQPQVIRDFGETFYRGMLSHFDHTGTGTIVLAGNQEGTAATLVDDKIVIKVQHPNGTTSTYQHDYSHGCTSTSALGPVNITSMFQVGANRVSVALMDVCGGEEASNAIWITAAP